MKKLVDVLLCLIMLLSLFSCNASENENHLPIPSETDAADDGGADDPEAKKAMESESKIKKETDT